MLGIYLLIIVILTIYHNSGLYLLVPFILAVLCFIISSVNLITNRFNLISRFIQIISLLFIILIIIMNLRELGNSIFMLSFVLPFSIDKINFLSEIRSDKLDLPKEVHIMDLYEWETIDIHDFLTKYLEDNQVYAVSFHYALDPINYKGELQKYLDIKGPILVTSQSNAQLISEFIYKEIKWYCDFNGYNENKIDCPWLTILFAKINI